jgi:hypothetical protein
MDAIAAPMPPAPVVRAPAPPMGMPLPVSDVPAPETVTPAGRLRRCTFRRIDRIVGRPGSPDRSTFQVMCLYGEGDQEYSLGDAGAAEPICARCTASGIFRPDED